MSKAEFCVFECQNIASINAKVDRPIIDYTNDWRLGNPVTHADGPKYLFWNGHLGVDTATKKLGDYFCIRGGIFAVTDEFAEFLKAFNLGETQLFPVSLYEIDEKTKLDGNFFVLHIAGIQNTFSPEQSSGIKLMNPETGLHIPWTDMDVAIMADDVAGVDLWRDPQLKGPIFCSSRLRDAINASDFVIRKKKFIPCRIAA